MPVTIAEEDELPLSDGESSASSTASTDSRDADGTYNSSDTNTNATRPHTVQPTNFFAPPFYGRPGTPLPPSPSITSLLIPSRPTTPDFSDGEDPSATGADASSSVAHPNGGSSSGAHGGGRPRNASPPKVPTYEYYGFVLYLFSSASFAIYLLWSYLPSPFLHALGIYYYPNRWWSLAVPAFLVIALVYVYVATASYNVGYLTAPMGSVGNIVDDAAKVAVIDGKGRFKDGSRLTRSKVRKVPGVTGKVLDYREVWSEGTDGVIDIPLGGVCEILYGGPDEEMDDGEEEDEGEATWWFS